MIREELRRAKRRPPRSELDLEAQDDNVRSPLEEAIGQEAIARQFASGLPPIVHWEGIGTREGQFAPLIDGALGWIEARTRAEHDAGDHTLFVADVITTEQGPSTSALVYRDRDYHGL